MCLLVDSTLEHSTGSAAVPEAEAEEAVVQVDSFVAVLVHQQPNKTNNKTHMFNYKKIA